MSGELIRLSVVESTNVYTSNLLSQSGIKNWTVIYADEQTNGKGQRGKGWDSDFGKNLLFSVFVKPSSLLIDNQHEISLATSLALCDALTEFGLDATIKWPNDILVEEQKIAGILIENQVTQRYIESTIIGIGLNVNQLQFSSYPWPATSIRKLTGENTDREHLLGRIIYFLRQRLEGNLFVKQNMVLEYTKRLYGYNDFVDFYYQNEVFTGVVKGIDKRGAILISKNDELPVSFHTGEISLKRT